MKTFESHWPFLKKHFQFFAGANHLHRARWVMSRVHRRQGLQKCQLQQTVYVYIYHMYTIYYMYSRGCWCYQYMKFIYQLSAKRDLTMFFQKIIGSHRDGAPLGLRNPPFFRSCGRRGHGIRFWCHKTAQGGLVFSSLLWFCLLWKLLLKHFSNLACICGLEMRPHLQTGHAIHWERCLDPYHFYKMQIFLCDAGAYP